MIIASVVNLVDRTDILINKLDELLKSTILPDFLYVSIALSYPRLGNKIYEQTQIDLLRYKLHTYPIQSKLVVYEEDIGPCMKLITPLKWHTFNEDDYILIFDDDVGLFPTAIECLISTAKKCSSKMVFSIMGLIQGNQFVHGEQIESGDYYPVDSVGGFRGVLYPIKLIDIPLFIKYVGYFIDGYKKYQMIAMHDDHIFCSFLNLHSIPLVVVNVYPKDRFNYDNVDVGNGIFQDEKVGEAVRIFEELKEAYSKG